MGLLNAFFLAADDHEAAALAAAPESLAGVQTGGMTGLELDSLREVLCGLDGGAASGASYVGEPGETWLQRIPADLSAALAALSEADVAGAAEAWVEADEDLDPSAVPALTGLLQELVVLARDADAARPALYFWGSI